MPEDWREERDDEVASAPEDGNAELPYEEDREPPWWAIKACHDI